MHGLTVGAEAPQGQGEVGSRVPRMYGRRREEFVGGIEECIRGQQLLSKCLVLVADELDNARKESTDSLAPRS